MSENRDYWSSANEEGSIKISEDVVASIASISTKEVEGVYDLTAGITSDIAGKLKGKNLSRGTRVSFNGNMVDLDVYYIVNSGFNIFEVSKKIQENIKSALESMTSLKLASANIHVAGINFDIEK